MKLLHLIPMFLPATAYGGPISVCASQVRALGPLGAQVEVSTTNVRSLRPLRLASPHLSEDLGFPVRYFSAGIAGQFLPSILSPGGLRWLWRQARKYDAVHVHFAREATPMLSCALLTLLGVRYVVQTHGMLNTRSRFKDLLDMLITRRLLEGAQAVLALQAHERGRLLEIAPRANTVTLPNGLSTEHVPYRWSPERLGARTILFLARLHPRKRVLDFIEAARILETRHAGFVYRIVGADGGDLAAARERISELGLGAQVTLVGALSPEACLRELAEASVYVLPSVDEPFPMSVLEALATGVPSVVTTGIHIRDLLEEHAAAEVVDPNPQALADGIFRVWKSPERAGTLSRNGRALIEDHLNITRVARDLLKLYAGGQSDA